MTISRTSVTISVEEAVSELASGHVIVLVDHPEETTRTALVMAGQFVTAEGLRMVRSLSEVPPCLSLPDERCRQLELEFAKPSEESMRSMLWVPYATAIQARDRLASGDALEESAHTIRVAMDPRTEADAIVQGGPLEAFKARTGGVLERAGCTEAAVDLTRIADLLPGGLLCEIRKDDGPMVETDDVREFCARHDLKLLAISDLIAWQRRRTQLVERVVETSFPTMFGRFTAVGYRSLQGDNAHLLALVKGDIQGRQDVPVRVLPKLFVVATCSTA